MSEKEDLDQLEKQIRDSGEQEQMSDEDINRAINNMRNVHKPKVLKEDDPMQAIMKNLPNLFNSMMNREKRCKLILELTIPELFKLSEFMMKEGMGKTQMMEDPS